MDVDDFKTEEEILAQMDEDFDDDVAVDESGAPIEEEPLKESDEEAEEEADDPDADEEEDPDEEGSDDDDPDEEEEEGGSEEDPDEEEEEDDPLASDESLVEVTVGDETKRVSVSELKRLAGQETALTQKSQALADQRRQVEAQGAYVTKVLQDRYEAAKERMDKFKDVDLYAARQELEDSDFNALREAKEGAEAELRTIETEARDFMKNAQANRKQLLQQQARENLKTIQREIPDWSDELYGNIRSYAVNQGMDQNAVNEVIDPAAILMMHKARLYDEAQKSTETKVKKKAAKAPKKVNRKASKTTDRRASKTKALKKKAMSSGSPEDIAALMEAESE